jgi:NAD(P)-dependent dehydrogenase (short-subunit alcohol dehydrogenase family)
MSISSPTSRVWFITGVSSGFGSALAEAALQRGDHVVGTLRQETQTAEFESRAPGRAKAVLMDVTRPEEIKTGVAAALAAFGHIDVLVNNAGYALLGAVEELEEADIRRQFETNFFGALNVTRLVLPHLRERRSGHIVNISSVGGFVGGPGWGLYCATKYALEGLSDCLAMETAPLGIHVTLVEPGAFRTGLGSSGTTKTEKRLLDYEPTVGKTRQWRAGSAGQEPGDPMKAAEAIIRAVESPQPPLRLVLGADALQLMREKIAQMSQELDQWEAVTVATAYEETQG